MTVTLAPIRSLLDHPLFRAGLAGACVLGGVAVIQAVQQEQQERLDALNEAIGHRRAELVSLRAQVARARTDATFPDRPPVDDVDQADAGAPVWSAEDGGPVDLSTARTVEP